MKRSIKFVFSLLLLLSLLGCTAFAESTTPSITAVTPVPTTLTDIAGHWAQEAIEDFVSKGYVKGYPDNTFKPDNQISRAEFMTLVNKVYAFTDKAVITYPDVPTGEWYYDEIAKAKAAGYISGYEDGTMRPNGFVTRQEAAAILFNLKKLTADSASLAEFTDLADIAAWANGPVGGVVKAGIMKGYPEKTFMPGRFLTRAEAVMLLRTSLTIGLLETEVPLGAPVVPAVARTGSNGGNNTPNALLPIETTSIEAFVDGNSVAGDPLASPTTTNTATIKFTGNGALSYVNIHGTPGVTLTLKNVVGDKRGSDANTSTFADMSNIPFSTLVGKSSNTDIDLVGLKAGFGDSDKITITGTLSKSGYTSRDVTMVLDLSGVRSKDLTTPAISASASGSVVTVTVNTPKTLISSVGLGHFISVIASSDGIVPVSAEVDGTKYTINDSLDDIRTKIGNILSPLGWTGATLADLLNKNLNMTIKDFGGQVYSVEFK